MVSVILLETFKKINFVFWNRYKLPEEVNLKSNRLWNKLKYFKL